MLYEILYLYRIGNRIKESDRFNVVPCESREVCPLKDQCSRQRVGGFWTVEYDFCIQVAIEDQSLRQELIDNGIMDYKPLIITLNDEKGWRK